MSNMKETLFNQIRKEEFDLIVQLGKGETKIPRYFFLSETEDFEPGKSYTILRIPTMVLSVMAITFIHN